MIDELLLTPIAHIKCDFPEKFGIPRQSGLVESLVARVVFEPKFRNTDALRGIEGYSHLWLIFGFSAEKQGEWSPTVRPPRLGGNTRVGVFASRSPNRPNPIGLSSVRLLSVCDDGSLSVGGADLMDGTPIYDIKPYLPYVDARHDAKGGFTENLGDYRLTVQYADGTDGVLPDDKKAVLTQLLAEDPRPSYHEDGRVYGMTYAGCGIKFSVRDKLLTVCEITKL